MLLPPTAREATAASGPARESLLAIGPDSKSNKDKHHDIPNGAQVSGTQMPFQTRQHRPRTDDAVHLPWLDSDCIREFQHGSECTKGKSSQTNKKEIGI